MNKHFHKAATALGLAAVAWVASGYLRGGALAHAPALAMTLLIAAAFLAGALELQRYQADTAGLRQALDSLHTPGTPPSGDTGWLAQWLGQVPAPLRHAVQLRLDGERVALPGPALTPYLVGLLVLLGMLGTFLGMVVTLNGTGVALDSATDVQTMRDSLAAPVRGLGLAFGTSVAGVAASALLGLMSAFSRRDRAAAGPLLDSHIATTLQPFTRAHRAQQQAAEQAREQAQHLPALVTQLQALATQLQAQQQQSAELAREHQQQGHAQLLKGQQQTSELLLQTQQRSSEQLLQSQEQLHRQLADAFQALATSVDATLQRSLSEALAESSRIAAATLQPAVETTMAGITRETAALHAQVAGTVQQQLQGFADRFEARTATWVDTLGTQLATQDTQRLAAWAGTLETTAQRISTQAEAQARHTVEEVSRLVQAASDAPRAAAEVVAQLRDKLSESLARDNAMLDERQRLLETLHTLLGTVQHTATEQKAAVDRMVASTAAWLDEAGSRFTAQLHTESARMEDMAAQLSGSAADVASLGEAFATAVADFAQASGQTVAQLQRVEEALAKSSARSDDQLAYVVAQAREVIDLSLLAQKQTVDELQRLARQQTASPAPATALEA